MDQDFYIAAFWLGISVTVNVALGLAWWGARKRVQRLEAQPSDPAQLDELFGRVVSSNEAIVGRLEDLVSGQEFMNRVITDRIDRLGRALPAREPRDTPV
jgi:hypothetical protein